MTSPSPALDPRLRHALHTLADDLDMNRRAFSATFDNGLAWDSISARMLRELAHDLAGDLRAAAYRLRDLAS